MSGRQFDLALVLLLGAVALSAWTAVNGRARAKRRFRLVLCDSGGVGDPGRVTAARATLARCVRRLPGPWPSPRTGRPVRLARELLLLPVGLGLGQVLHSPVPVVVAALLVLPLRRSRQRRTTLRQARARAAALIELCAALAGELRGGATPEQALEIVTGLGRWVGDLAERLGPEALARLAAGRYGADVPAAFRRLAELPGGAGAAAIGACWRVTADSGSGLASALDRVAEALRAERALEEEIQGELAGPRTTARLLAGLPVFGLLLGVVLGAQPQRVLLHTPLGLGCLGAGALLEVGGLVWTGLIAHRAQHVGSGPGTRARSRAPGEPGRRPVGRGAGWAGAWASEVAW